MKIWGPKSFTEDEGIFLFASASEAGDFYVKEVQKIKRDTGAKSTSLGIEKNEAGDWVILRFNTKGSGYSVLGFNEFHPDGSHQYAFYTAVR